MKSEDLTKEEKINNETKRLKKVFRGLDKNKRETVDSLIRSAAFMAVSLAELEDIINRNGYTVEYQNGANQSGTKQSDEVKTHIAMLKNYSSVIKQLCELLPPEQRQDSRIEEIRKM